MNGTHLYLTYSHPEGDGEPVSACDPQHIDFIDPNFDIHGLYTKRAINTLLSLADVQHTAPMTMPSPKSITQANKHHVKSETPDYRNSPLGSVLKSVPDSICIHPTRTP